MSTDLALPTPSDPSKWDDKFDKIVKAWRDDTVTLPATLDRQLKHWITIHGILSTARYPRTTQQVNAILKAIPGISARTARNYLADTKKFFSTVDQIDLPYERLMLIEELRDDIRVAKKRSDMRAVAALRKLYKTAIGADKPQESVENKTVLNIINYNPEQLGGVVISDDALDKMIANFMAEDKKKAEDLFDDYTDVTNNPTQAQGS